MRNSKAIIIKKEINKLNKYYMKRGLFIKILFIEYAKNLEKPYSYIKEIVNKYSIKQYKRVQYNKKVKVNSMEDLIKHFRDYFVHNITTSIWQNIPKTEYTNVGITETILYNYQNNDLIIKIWEWEISYNTIIDLTTEIIKEHKTKNKNNINFINFLQ